MKKEKRSTLGSIEKRIFRTQILLVITLTLFLGIAGTVINIRFQTEKRNQTLREIADAVVESLILTEDESGVMVSEKQSEYLGFLRDTIEEIDVISVINADGVRVFHTTEDLIGTAYDGTIPEQGLLAEGYYITDDIGPSGTQRRAYAGIYDEDGTYLGFVLTVSLMQNIYHDLFRIILVFAAIMVTAIFAELMLSRSLSLRIKKELRGYEPDVFSAMYSMRDNILESLDEGIVAFDQDGDLQFANHSAEKMLGEEISHFRPDSTDCENRNVLVERVPIQENGEQAGCISILRDREEYTKLMEDLAGTRYLVDSMRANNHEFTNKLHVILGLIQMEMYEEAESYIQNITVVQRESIGEIMKKIDEPALAALLIGKLSRASELNVNFVFRQDSEYRKAGSPLSGDMLVTIVGNLIDNAMDAMNTADYSRSKELYFGIYTGPDGLLITVEDTGEGIDPENREHIFEKGFTSKGSGHGTGLYRIKTILDSLGGTIVCESEPGVGTSFTVKVGKGE